MGSGIIHEYSGNRRSPSIMLSASPSFNSCSSSSNKLAEIAARVIRELGHVSPPDSLYDDDYEFVLPEQLVIEDQNRKEIPKGDDQNDDVEEEDEEEEEEEFEFSFASVEPDVTADEIFYNGQIRPLYYPLFNTALLKDEPPSPPPRPQQKMEVETTKKLPLGKLFLREEYWPETASSCSSSEAEELEGVPAESYCVWNPKENKTTTSGMRKKSNSTGSVSKRWKLKNMLLYRSNSVDENNNNNNNNNIESDNTYDHVVLFTSDNKKKSGVKELGGGHLGDLKRRSYLPYRQGLVGFFPSVNGFSRKLHPF